VRLHSVFELIVGETTASLRLEVDNIRCEPSTVCQFRSSVRSPVQIVISFAMVLGDALAGITMTVCP
jgi:hypothetical protein